MDRHLIQKLLRWARPPGVNLSPVDGNGPQVEIQPKEGKAGDIVTPVVGFGQVKVVATGEVEGDPG